MNTLSALFTAGCTVVANLDGQVPADNSTDTTTDTVESSPPPTQTAGEKTHLPPVDAGDCSIIGVFCQLASGGGKVVERHPNGNLVLAGTVGNVLVRAPSCVNLTYENVLAVAWEVDPEQLVGSELQWYGQGLLHTANPVEDTDNSWLGSVTIPESVYGIPECNSELRSFIMDELPSDSSDYIMQFTAQTTRFLAGSAECPINGTEADSG